MLQKARYGLNLNTGIGNRNWVFKTENCTLYKMASTKIIRHNQRQSSCI